MKTVKVKTVENLVEMLSEMKAGVIIFEVVGEEIDKSRLSLIARRGMSHRKDHVVIHLRKLGDRLVRAVCEFHEG